jgi:hypothetical protein
LTNGVVNNVDKSALPSNNFNFTGGIRWNLVIPPGSTQSASTYLFGNSQVPPSPDAPAIISAIPLDQAARITFNASANAA